MRINETAEAIQRASGSRHRRSGFSVTGLVQMTPNHALEPTAASALRLLAVPSSLRSSAAAQRER